MSQYLKKQSCLKIHVLGCFTVLGYGFLNETQDLRAKKRRTYTPIIVSVLSLSIQCVA